MPVSVTMPRLGESVTEGTVTRWLKQEGDRVEVDEPLLEVSTDKVDTEIPSPAAGVLSRIVVGEDETVEVGSRAGGHRRRGRGRGLGRRGAAPAAGRRAAAAPAAGRRAGAAAEAAPPPRRPPRPQPPAAPAAAAPARRGHRR